MMYPIIGILIILFGFIAPFISDGKLNSTLFFWIGFLLLVSPVRIRSPATYWLGWAKVGLVTNILGGIISLIYSQVLLNTFLAKNYISGKIFSALMWLVSPITQLLVIVLPYPRTDLSTNSEIIVQFQITFSRSSVTSLLDIIFIMLIAILIGKFVRKKYRSSK